MADYKFKIGQFVYFHPSKRLASSAPSEVFQIIKRSLAKDGEAEYRRQKPRRRTGTPRERKRVDTRLKFPRPTRNESDMFAAWR